MEGVILMNKKVLVFGLGDTQHSDDGFGVHVINYLKKQNRLKNAEILDGALLQSNLPESFSDVDQLIVIETAEFNSDPGSVKVFEGIEMDAFVRKDKIACIHKTGINHILNMTRSQGQLPNHRALVCLQPESLSQGNELSEQGVTAIPKACKKVFEISVNWVI